MKRETIAPRAVSPAAPSISVAAAFIARISFFSLVTTSASGTTLITAASCASAATFARCCARLRPARTPIQISMMSAKTQNATNATRPGVSIQLMIATRTRPPLDFVFGAVVVVVRSLPAGCVPVRWTVVGRVPWVAAGVLEAPGAFLPWPLACDGFVIPPPPAEGCGAGVDDAHAGPTLSKPVCTPFVRRPPTTGSGVASVQTGSADAGGMTSANAAADTSTTPPMLARFMASSVPGSPQIIHAPLGPNAPSPQ